MLDPTHMTQHVPTTDDSVGQRLFIGGIRNDPEVLAEYLDLSELEASIRFDPWSTPRSSPICGGHWSCIRTVTWTRTCKPWPTYDRTIASYRIAHNVRNRRGGGHPLVPGT